MMVRVNPRTIQKIFGIYNYIAAQGYPETGLKYIERLYSFIESLNAFPEKYPVCRHSVWRKRKYRCAVFESNYVVAYKVLPKIIMVIDIRHAATLV